MFGSATGADPVLNRSIEENGFVITSPAEAEDVSLIIIDRPSANAARICANLRGQDQFLAVPILVLLEPSDTGDLTIFSDFNADVLIKPVTDRALCNYLARIASSISDKHAWRGEPDRAEKEPYEEPLLESSPALDLPADDDQTASTGEIGQVIEDLIPASNNLLPHTVPPSSVPKGGVLCRSCRSWECRKEDVFCSRCGAALAILDLAREALSFEPLGNHSVGQLLTLVSSGQNPVRMAFTISGRDDLRNRFSLHAREAILESGGMADLLVVFDARGLDLSTTHRATLEIVTNEGSRSGRSVELIVEPLAIPAFTIRECYQYISGATNYWEVRLANDGGGTLGLAGVKLDGNDLSFGGPIQVKGGQEVSVQLLIPDLEYPVGETVSGTLIFELAHYPPVIRSILITAVRPPRLVAQPPELDFAVVSTRRSQRIPLTLINAGGEELIIESLITSHEWIECLIDVPISIKPGQSRVFDVQVVGSADLAGDHSCEITISSNCFQSSVQRIPLL
ncbi:MAG TPA: hypothetical protein VNO14_08360, partial [Blastocatellia bacterium]|nr:hypothetical protein [Blastocatellia bacterium]